IRNGGLEGKGVDSGGGGFVKKKEGVDDWSLVSGDGVGSWLEGGADGVGGGLAGLHVEGGCFEEDVGLCFFQAEDGIRDWSVTGVQTCALPICELTSLGKAALLLDLAWVLRD